MPSWLPSTANTSPTSGARENLIDKPWYSITGSSTVLSLLAGLRQPDSGTIRIDDVDLRSWHLESLRSGVALVRGGEILEGTIADNVRLGRPEVRADEIRGAMARVGLLEEVLALLGCLLFVLQVTVLGWPLRVCAWITITMIFLLRLAAIRYGFRSKPLPAFRNSTRAPH
jgi:ABC-type transport system involved in cytochrome bd biosynthesis fused ATPase/permease subunit